MEEADRYAAEHGLEGFAVDEIMFNLAKANEKTVLEATQSCVNDEIFRYHNRKQRPLTAYTSQAAGFFALYQEEDFLTNGEYSFPRDYFYNKATLGRARAGGSTERADRTFRTGDYVRIFVCPAFSGHPDRGAMEGRRVKEQYPGGGVQAFKGRAGFPSGRGGILRCMVLHRFR